MGGGFNGGYAAASFDPLLFIGLVGGGTWLVVGIVFLAIGLAGRRRKWQLSKKCTAVVMGRVADIVQSAGQSGGTLWKPLFTYDVDGLQYVKTPSTATSSINYAIGELVEVRYNPNDPHECYIARDRSSNTLSLVFTIIGAGLLVIALCWFIGFLVVFPNS